MMGFKGLLKKGYRPRDSNEDGCALSPHLTKDGGKKKLRSISLPVATVKALQVAEKSLVLKPSPQSQTKTETSLSQKIRLHVSRSRVASAPSILKKSSTFSSASTGTTRTVSSASTITTARRVNSFDSHYESTWKSRLKVDRGIKRSPTSRSGSTKVWKDRPKKPRRIISGIPSIKASRRLSLVDDRDETESIGSTETRTVSNASGKTGPARRYRSLQRLDEGSAYFHEDHAFAVDPASKACCDWADPLKRLQEYANNLSISQRFFEREDDWEFKNSASW